MMVIGTKEKNLNTARRFSETLFWLPEHRDMFAADFTFEFPFAPPGWLQRLSPGETAAHFAWLNRSIRSWTWTNTKVYATNFPNRFWVMRDGAGAVFWGGRDGRYESRFLTLLTIEDGVILRMKDHFDSVAMYEAIGVTLPLFKYDAPPGESMPAKPPVRDVSGDPAALAAKTKATLSKFVAVDFWDDEEINADDIVHELPFAPPAMPRRYEGREYDALNAWIGENCLEWTTYPGNTLYETDEPGVYFIESGGYGFMSWTGVKGTYQQRELSFLRIEDGYAKEFHEYFNATNKFNSINSPIPTFPYLY